MAPPGANESPNCRRSPRAQLQTRRAACAAVGVVESLEANVSGGGAWWTAPIRQLRALVARRAGTFTHLLRESAPAALPGSPRLRAAPCGAVRCAAYRLVKENNQPKLLQFENALGRDAVHSGATVREARELAMVDVQALPPAFSGYSRVLAAGSPTRGAQAR